MIGELLKIAYQRLAIKKGLCYSRPCSTVFPLCGSLLFLSCSCLPPSIVTNLKSSDFFFVYPQVVLDPTIRPFRGSIWGKSRNLFFCDYFIYFDISVHFYLYQLKEFFFGSCFEIYNGFFYH